MNEVAENSILQRLRDLSDKLEPPVELSAHHEHEFYATEADKLLLLAAAGTITVLEDKVAVQAEEVERLQSVILYYVARQENWYRDERIHDPSIHDEYYKLFKRALAGDGASIERERQ